MKYFILCIALLTISITHLRAQSWQQLMDSTKFYQDKSDYPIALEFAKLALPQAQKEFGEKDTNYLKNFGKLAELFYYYGKLDSAVIYQEQHLKNCRLIFFSDNNILAESINNMALFFKDVGNNKDAELLYIEAIEMYRRIFSGDHPDLAKSINNMAGFYNEIGNYREAEPLFKEALEMFRRLHTGDHTDLANSINNMALFYNDIGNYTEAQPLYLEALEMRRRIYHGDHPDLALSINNMGKFYYDRGNYKEAERFLKEALEMRRHLFKSDDPYLARSINNMAVFYYGTGNYKEAEPLYKEALGMYRRIYSGDHPDLANSINNMASFYDDIGNYTEAEQLYKKALEMRKRIYHGDHPDLAISINNMACYYNSRGNFKDAEPLYKKALEMRRRIYSGDHTDLASSINNMASFYNDIGNYTEAQPLYQEALEMRKRIFHGDHPDLAISINNLASFYDNIGYYKEAELLYKEALGMRKRIFNRDHPDLAKSINNMASFYDDIGNYTEAEQLYKKALEMRRRFFHGDHPDLAISINNMACYYNSRGNFKDAEPLYKEALEMRRRIYSGDHTDLASSINNMASLYEDIANYKEAETYYKKALEMYRRIYPRDHPDLAISLNNMANFYNGRCNYTVAEPLYKEALEIFRRIFKTEHQQKAYILYNLARNTLSQSKLAEAEPLYNDAVSMYFIIFSKNSTNLSEKEKKQYWSTMSSAFESFNHFAIIRQKENPSILCKMYDNQLMTKALLYNSTSKIKKRILASNDSALKADYMEFISMKERLVKFYNMTKAELEMKQIKIDSLVELANDLEKKISIKSEDYKQSYEKKKIDWKSVQFALKPDEAAVEMVRFRKYDVKGATDTVLYAALVVSDQTTDYPELILLENGNELEDKYYPAYRKLTKSKTTDKESFKAFWEKIYNKTKQYKKIYFSPDGIYNKLNVSTFELPDGKYLLEQQDIQTMNSTKDLLLSFYSRHEESNVYNSALLIGNPKFDLDTTKLKEAELLASAERDGAYYFMDNLRNVALNELPGTEIEVQNIENYLKSKNWVVNSYTKANAIKARVKNAKNPRVLHIATHGFFLPDTDTSNKYLSEMNPLFKTGLFFAGASTEKSDENHDIGFLTAYEAMNLDLDKTELVVLSACETGLGEVKNGEGVFGLRRAFQQAGARSVLMSLWNVDDEATQELMTNFYENWLSGKSKREAFNLAQLKIKEKYIHPYYWGAFVLVGE